MEQSVGWSRLVCSWQWRVKEITLGLCQQPWPCSHRSIMRRDMLGLPERKRLKFEAFFTDSYRRQTAFLRVVLQAEVKKWDRCIPQGWTRWLHITSRLRLPSATMKTQIALLQWRQKCSILHLLRALLTDFQHSTKALLKIDASVLWVCVFWFFWRFEWQSLPLMTERRRCHCLRWVQSKRWSLWLHPNMRWVYWSVSFIISSSLCD